MNALRSERGSVVLGGLTRLLVVLLVIGALAYDAFAIGYGRFKVAERGTLAADAAGETWRNTADPRKAYEVAQQTLDPTGEVIDPTTFSIDPETDTVRFHLTGAAPTLLAQRLSFTRSLRVVEVDIRTSSAAPSS